MEHIKCIVDRVSYRCEENGFSILRVSAEGILDAFAAKGIIPDPHVGATLFLDGEWNIDPRYGKQFLVSSYVESLPNTTLGIQRYLSSGLIKGIGENYAQKIVTAFGVDTLEIMENHPERLREVSGIGPKRVEKIIQSWQKQKDIKAIMIFLQGHGVSTSHAVKIFKNYGKNSLKIVGENPYCLTELPGIGFQTADTIASKLGIEKENPLRLESGLLYTLTKLAESGHCFAYEKQLFKTGAKLLDVPTELLTNILPNLEQQEKVIHEEDCVYLPQYYHAETKSAEKILELLKYKTQTEKLRKDLKRLIELVVEKSGIEYDEIQLDAILTAVSSKFMVLTGGPGTGKTTTTMGILTAYQIIGSKILLAAPTGRAAKRLSEATGMEAKTIHRLLEYNPQAGYVKNEEEPLEGDVLIVDECSMIDISLMYHLLKAIPPHMTVILVGDIDQLPSVGAGNVLKDIISSEAVPVVRLKRIFRQAQNSMIIMNAHRINNGEPIDVSICENADFFFVPKDSDEDVVQKLVEYCTSNLPRYYKMNPMQDIQVLTPMKKGMCGTENLNALLQEKLNPSKVFLKHGAVQFRLGDKVMQIRNNYDKGVFNGDIGNITYVDIEEGQLTISFDGYNVSYKDDELDELVLAYATTIHKSQGSEYPIVVMPLTYSHYVMLQRNLLYTAVTRAKKIFVLIGDKKAVSTTIRNNFSSIRNSKLCIRLRTGQKSVNI